MDPKQANCFACVRTRRPFPYECNHEWKRCTDPVRIEILAKSTIKEKGYLAIALLTFFGQSDDHAGEAAIFFLLPVEADRVPFDFIIRDSFDFNSIVIITPYRSRGFEVTTEKECNG